MSNTYNTIQFFVLKYQSTYTWDRRIHSILEYSRIDEIVVYMSIYGSRRTSDANESDANES